MKEERGREGEGRVRKGARRAKMEGVDIAWPDL